MCVKIKIFPPRMTPMIQFLALKLPSVRRLCADFTGQLKVIGLPPLYDTALSEWRRCECKSGMMAQLELNARVVCLCLPVHSKRSVFLIQQGNSYCAADLGGPGDFRS